MADGSPSWGELIGGALAGGGLIEAVRLIASRRRERATAATDEAEARKRAIEADGLAIGQWRELYEEMKRQVDALRAEVQALRAENSVLRERIESMELKAGL